MKNDVRAEQNGILDNDMVDESFSSSYGITVALEILSSIATNA